MFEKLLLPFSQVNIAFISKHLPLHPKINVVHIPLKETSFPNRCRLLQGFRSRLVKMQRLSDHRMQRPNQYISNTIPIPKAQET